MACPTPMNVYFCSHTSKHARIPPNTAAMPCEDDTTGMMAVNRKVHLIISFILSFQIVQHLNLTASDYKWDIPFNNVIKESTRRGGH